jgi:hypothetical protein
MSKVLRGDRNQCQGCKEYFNSTSAFDKHRVGEFGKDRRCRTTEEMTALGMGLNADGFWVKTIYDGNAFWNRLDNYASDLNARVEELPTPNQRIAEIEGGER